MGSFLHLLKASAKSLTFAASWLCSNNSKCLSECGWSSYLSAQMAGISAYVCCFPALLKSLKYLFPTNHGTASTTSTLRHLSGPPKEDVVVGMFCPFLKPCLATPMFAASMSFSIYSSLKFEWILPFICSKNKSRERHVLLPASAQNAQITTSNAPWRRLYLFKIHATYLALQNKYSQAYVLSFSPKKIHNSSCSLPSWLCSKRSNTYSQRLMAPPLSLHLYDTYMVSQSYIDTVYVLSFS
jgi:hypothetical protein